MLVTSEKKAKILLADDHTLLRETIRLLIDNEPDMYVVGDVTNGEDLIGLATQIRFDLALVDINMPGINGLKAAKELKRLSPSVHILIWSGFDNPAYMQTSQEIGVDGFLFKDCSSQELITTIRLLLKGHQIFPRRQTATNMLGSAHRPTNREVEVMRLVAEGLSNKEIAISLDLSKRTVEYHLNHLYSKLGVMKRGEAVRKIIELGWLIEV
jgi:DNA-binding NarL/FixJ family response regulator